MRITSSHYSESIRSRPSHFWSTLRHGNSFCPVLNTGNLLKLIDAAGFTPTNASISRTNGKKRAASRSVSPDPRKYKRLRGSVVRVLTTAEDDEVDRIAGDQVKSLYPAVFIGNVSWPVDNNQVSVYRHGFEIQYNNAAHDDSTEYANDTTAKELGWLGDEHRLISSLEKLSTSLTEPQTVHLGPLNLGEYCGRLVAMSPVLYGREKSSLLGFDSREWILLLPAFTPPVDIGDNDYSSNRVSDMVMASHILASAGRARVLANLNLILLPSNTNDKSQHELPFRLQIEINVSLLIPRIFEPITDGTSKKRTEIEDAQRRVLTYVFPSQSHDAHVDAGEATIHSFYSILRPAPVLSKLAEEAMQPEALLPNLLPFQRRSVAWMLDREGKVVMPQGEVVPKPTANKSEALLPLFWGRVEIENHIWYLNRLSGALTPELPLHKDVFGGILAEEQGLGKTIICLSLIMLNPAPERNPSIKRWDPEARLDVKEIKTTLIVTPPALASQWADEFALHAPSLRIFVYEGWAKVGIPITENDAEEERLRQLRLKRKGKATTASGSKGKIGIRKGKRKAGAGNNTKDSEAPDRGDDNPEVLDWCSWINTFDVCITTYTVLRNDLNVARAAPVRPRREDVVYSNVERPRSPLILCEWNRVIMDEVQMVGGGKTEDMVSLIPRLSSFAVSGTPVKTQVSDLMHVLKFLRVDDAIGSARLWNRLLKSGFAGSFADLFHQYAIRTTKLGVKDELTIPQQTRYLVGIEMGPVERHVYDQHLEVALLELGLDAKGVAASEGWQVDGALLRSALRRLRGICTHPQVGELQRLGDKGNKSGSLKTMADVLEAMRDQNWRNLMDDSKSKVQILIRRAQLEQHDEADRNRYQHALDTLLLAEREIVQLIQEIKTVIADHSAKGQILKDEAAGLKAAEDRAVLNPENADDMDSSLGKGKDKARATSPSFSTQDSEDDPDLPRNPAGEEHALKRRTLQKRLRECNVTLHRVKFLQGDLYHVLGEFHQAKEDAAYEAAEKIRQDLLKATEQVALRAMNQLTNDEAARELTEDRLLIPVPYLEGGGLRSRDLMDEANEIIEDVLNEQSALLWKWRSSLLALLTQKLSPGNGEADGQEYQRTLDDQGEAETYLQAYTALLADRREALVNERTLLAAHDAREKLLRHTKAAMKAAAAAEADVLLFDDVELQPEHEVLQKELAQKRKQLIQELDGRAIKSVLINLSGVVNRIHKEDDPEKLIVKEAVTELRTLIAEQGVLMDVLDADLARFRRAFNDRILFYRQLQEISDSVMEVSWDNTVVEAIQMCKTEQADLETKVNTNRARQRFLDHLSKSKDDKNTNEDDEACILCRCEFTRGYITPCAHMFCEGCMKAWLQRREGKTCPVCRVPIDKDQLQRFTVNEAEPTLPPKIVNGEPAPKSLRQIQYNMIDRDLFSKIQNVESDGSYGSKIQTLVRHLLYLQATDPGAKSIVFSAWADSLHIIEHALIINGIRCIRIDQHKQGQSAAKKFRTDPGILVLLLHGERENAGLNVTCASRVFLVESVVHHGFELQAIARIDRMGQTRPTEVYCYYAEETVEKNILDLAARRGLSLYTKENSAGTLNVSSFNVDADKKTVDSPVKKVQKGDFIYKIDDMLAILFPHMFEDLEYLLPPQDDITMDPPSMELEPNQSLHEPRDSNIYVNAAAGPSRHNFSS